MSYFGIPLRNGLPIGLGSVAALGTNAVFNPASLFANGEQGWIYNPSDFNRYMSPLGSELITNGDFSAGTTGWTATDAQSVVSGELIVSGAAATKWSYQVVPTVIGKFYQIGGTRRGLTGSAIVWAGISSGNNALGATSTTTAGNSNLNNLIFIATTTTTFIQCLAVGAGLTAGFDNISVRELTAINTATLFQDSAGTTPVTAVEQPVGLQLDLSQGAPTTGPELITNGTFNSGIAGWSNGSTGGGSIAWNASEYIDLIASTGTGIADQSFSTVSGKTYQIQIQNKGGGAFSIYIGTTPGNNNLLSQTLASGLSRTSIFTAQGSTSYFRIANLTATTTVGVDNISVKELPGNHRYQSTSANRPVVSARVNLLTKTEEFDNAVWTKNNSTITVNTTIAPDGTTTADTMRCVAFGADCWVNQLASPSGVAYIGSCRFKYIDNAWVAFSNSGYFAFFNIQTGTLGTVQNGSATITDVGDGWYQCTWSQTDATQTGPFRIRMAGANGSATTTPANASVFIWGADSRVTNQGVGLPAYQYVNTSTDYTSAGFPIYIKPNGSNQFMQTNSINFTATDKMTVWQGVRKLSDAAVGSLQETFLNFTVAGGYGIYAPPAAATASYAFLMTGATGSQSNSSPTTYASPITNVLFVSMNIGVLGYAGMFAKINAQSIVLTNSGAGVTSIGNFANAPIYFYMRGGSTLPFNGNDYASIARGAASTATQITDGETWVNNLTKAY